MQITLFVTGSYTVPVSVGWIIHYPGVLPLHIVISTLKESSPVALQEDKLVLDKAVCWNRVKLIVSLFFCPLSILGS